MNHTLEKKDVGRHDVADVVLETQQPIAFDLSADCEATGRFVIVDGYAPGSRRPAGPRSRRHRRAR